MKKKLFMTSILVIILVISAIIIKIVFGLNVPFLSLGRENTYTKTNSIYSIGIYTGENPFCLREPAEITNPVLTADNINDIKAEFVADPFIVHSKNGWYMFFEVMNINTGQGDIGVATSQNGLEWDYLQIVLDEPFHMSYPNVFQFENSYYMIPETNEQKAIRLYKAKNFPIDWEYESTILTGLNFTDSTLFEHDNCYWIFTETNPLKDSTLRLYYADSIFGPWKEHPKSPVVSNDENIARPGGGVIVFENKLFRVTQDDWPTYGNKIRIFQLDKLTKTDYSEHELCDYPELLDRNIEPGLLVSSWRLDGFHQFDVHSLNAKKWYACIDGINRTSIHSQLFLKIKIPFTTISLNQLKKDS